MGSVTALPGVALAQDEPPTLNLTAVELVAASGGYKLAPHQLRALHERGFTRAFIGMNGKVILERAHYQAVTRGQFGSPAANDAPAARAPLPPNRAGHKAKFGKKRGG